MSMIEKIERVRFYLDYVEEHYKNVQKAFNFIKARCQDMKFMKDDYYFDLLNEAIENHDLSKLSAYEFIQYQEKFYPTGLESLRKEDIRFAFKIAFEHHKNNNLHHVESWTDHFKNTTFNDPYMWNIHCVHMIIDWMAMGYKFDDTAYDFYQRVKKNLKLSVEAIDLIDQIFQRVYGKSIKEDDTDAF
jgi:hypothetical protein